MQDLKEAREKLFQRNEELHRVMRVGLGETAAPGYRMRSLMEDPTRRPLSEEYIVQLAPEYNEFADVVRRKLASLPTPDHGDPISSENLWLWGGPTPEWGGSMQPETLMRTAPTFSAENGVYVYGATSDEMLARHAGMKKLLAMVTNTCRAPGQQPETDAECAEKLSRLSLKFPNIKGGMMDDMTAQLDDVTPEKLEQVAAVRKNLKMHNPDLELYGVVYCHELGKKNYTELHPLLDGVNLWFWNQEELLEIEKYVTLCRENFPGKKILMGLFLHDYGTADAGALPELLLHQLSWARHYLTEGKINGLVILGDREIMKWPEQAAAVKGFLAGK